MIAMAQAKRVRREYWFHDDVLTPANDGLTVIVGQSLYNYLTAALKKKQAKP